MLQFLCCLFTTADTHPAFPESQVKYFMDFSPFFNDGILSDYTDICGTVFYIGRYIRTFCKEEPESQFLIGEDQLREFYLSSRRR